MSEDVRDMPVAELRAGMTVDMEETAERWGGSVDATLYEFATVEAVEPVWMLDLDEAGVLLHTDQGIYALPTHWTVPWIAHLDNETVEV